MEAFFRCLQQDDDGETLSPSELKDLRDVLGLSSIVSANVGEFKMDANDFVVRLRGNLNKKYSNKYLNKKRPLIEKFRLSKSEGKVFLALPAGLGWYRFTVQIEEDHWGFGLETLETLETEDANDLLSKVERHFRGKLASVDKVELSRDRYLAWYWRSADSSDEEDLLGSLHSVLDEMLPKLYDLCKRFKG